MTAPPPTQSPARFVHGRSRSLAARRYRFSASALATTIQNSTHKPMSPIKTQFKPGSRPSSIWTRLRLTIIVARYLHERATARSGDDYFVFHAKAETSANNTAAVPIQIHIGAPHSPIPLTR